MTLDDLLGEEEVERIAGKPFGIAMKRNAGGVYEFDPKFPYEIKEFVRRAGDLFDLEEYYGKLIQNSGDVGALNDLTGLVTNYIEGDDEYKAEWVAQAKENPHLALSRGDKCLSSGYESMARFVESHRTDLLDKLSGEQLFAILSSPRIPLYKIGDKKHDRVVDLRNKILQIQKASEEKGDLTSVVGEELKGLIGRIPVEHQAYIFENQHLVFPSLARVIVRALLKQYDSLFKNREGEYDKKALIKYLEANYKAAEDFIDEIPESERKERQDYWDKNQKVHYLEVARMLYASEKKEQKEEDNPEKEDRKKVAREMGIQA